MFLTVLWDIPKLGKIARCMSCIIKSNYIIIYDSFQMNCEKLVVFKMHRLYSSFEK